MPSELEEILENPEILKVGVEPNNGPTFLHGNRVSFWVSSTFDLRFLAEVANCKPLSVDEMAKNYLKPNLRLRASILNDQIDNARNACDGIELFKFFVKRLQQKEPVGLQNIIEMYCIKYVCKRYNYIGEVKIVKTLNPKFTSIICACKRGFKHQIEFIYDENDCLMWIKELKSHCDEFKVLGLILYTKNKPDPYLELASHRGFCIQIQPSKLKTIPALLREILEDENIVKVGCALRGAELFTQTHGFCIASTLDIRFMLKPPIRFKEIVKKHLGGVYLKRYRIKAHICIALFQIFAKKLRPKLALESQLTYTQNIIHEYCSRYLNISYEKALRKIPFTILVDGNDNHALAMQTLKLHCNEFNVLGIDAKWIERINIPKSIASLILTTHCGFCLIIEIREDRIPQEIKVLLEDDNIIKVGVVTKDVVDYFLQKYDVNVASTLDIRYMAKMLGHETESLRNMFRKHLKATPFVRRRKKVKLNSKRELTKRQMEYVSNDAREAIELFKFYAEELKLKIPIEEQSNYVQFIINEYYLKYLNTYYDEAIEINDIRLF